MDFNFIDTHAHLDFFNEESRFSEMLKRANAAGVTEIITCSARKPDWELYSKIAKEHAGKIHWQFGIHPTEVEEADAEILEAEFEKYMNSDCPPVSVGEIGLDFYRLPQDEAEAAKEIALQKEIFKLQLKLAKNADMPVCVHARSAIYECIEMIKESGANFENFVFHCFSGNAEDMKALNALDGRASFTGIITYKNADEMRAAMRAQGLSKLMFETDCPYLAPTPHRGKDNEPAHIPLIAQKAAELFGISLKEIADITSANARKFFRLK